MIPFKALLVVKNATKRGYWTRVADESELGLFKKEKEKKVRR